MKEIAQLGTFDVENYGDLLYPHIFPRLISSRPIRHYSLLSGKAPSEAGFSTQSIRSLFTGRANEPLTLLVGGGDLLRTDSDIVARHYGRKSRTSTQTLRRSLGMSGYAGYVLREKIPRLDAANFYARTFRTRWMSHPGAGPFMIDQHALPPKSVVAYASCGVPHEFTPGESEVVKRVLDAASYIWLRDEQSAEKLRRAGVCQELHVAPDVAVVLSDYFNRDELVKRGRKILSQIGIDVNKAVTCFQSQPYPGFSEDEIVAELMEHKKRSNAEIVLLPLAYCHGDHEFLERLAQRAQGELNYCGANSVFDMMAVIAACDLFIGTSLHGNITAFSFGIPHLFGPLPVAKVGGFLAVAKLPAELKLQSWRELPEKIDFARSLGDEFLTARMREAKAAVHREVDQLLPDLVKCANA